MSTINSLSLISLTRQTVMALIAEEFPDLACDVEVFWKPDRHVVKFGFGDRVHMDSAKAGRIEELRQAIRNAAVSLAPKIEEPH